MSKKTKNKGAGPMAITPTISGAMNDSETEVDTVEEVAPDVPEEIIVESGIPTEVDAVVTEAPSIPTEPEPIETVVTPVVPEAPIENITTPVSQETAPIVENLSPQEKFMQSYIDHYEKVISDPKTTADLTNHAFEQILKYALSFQNDDRILGMLQAFVFKYKETCLHPKHALQFNVTKKHNPKLNLVYTLIKELITGKPMHIDLDYATKILGGNGLLNYVSARLPK